MVVLGQNPSYLSFSRIPIGATRVNNRFHIHRLRLFIIQRSLFRMLSKLCNEVPMTLISSVGVLCLTDRKNCELDSIETYPEISLKGSTFYRKVVYKTIICYFELQSHEIKDAVLGAEAGIQKYSTVYQREMERCNVTVWSYMLQYLPVSFWNESKTVVVSLFMLRYSSLNKYPTSIGYLLRHAILQPASVSLGVENRS